MQRELGQSWPFRSMRGLRMQWSHAFGLMCEVALTEAKGANAPR
jgi:hypothetical protein